MKHHKFALAALLAMLLPQLAASQVAHWLIPPVYDKIYKVIGADLIATDSLKDKVLWSFDGKRLFHTTYSIYPFREDIGLTTLNNTTAITGFVNTRGVFTPLKDYLVPHGYPYFSCGYLLVKKDGYYHFLDKNGNRCIQNCAMAWPFRHGYAAAAAYQSGKKEKVFSPMLLNRKGKPVKFFLQGKAVDDKDLQFVSTVNDDSLSLIVAQNQLFFFDTRTQQLSPIAPQPVTTQGTADDFIQENDDNTFTLHAQSAGGEAVTLWLDALRAPVKMTIGQQTTQFTVEKREKWHTATFLGVTERNGKKGLNWEDQEVLPPQFDDVLTRYDNKAFVKSAGKFGLIAIDPDKQLQFVLNKGNALAFRHHHLATTLRLNLPPGITAQNASIESDEEAGCAIDPSTRKAKDSFDGSYVQYDCVLTIPDDIADEPGPVNFSARASYDGLVTARIPFTAEGWHYKYFTIDINDVETTISQGNLFFTFNINADRLPGEEDYPVTVNIVADKLNTSLEKISETYYKCKATGLRAGVNQVIIQIQEPGCPPTQYPLEVTYTNSQPKQPNAKTANRKGHQPAQEKVVIQKKAQKTKTPTSSKNPYLEI